VINNGVNLSCFQINVDIYIYIYICTNFSKERNYSEEKVSFVILQAVGRSADGLASFEEGGSSTLIVCII